MASKPCVFRFGSVEVREREFTLVKAGEVVPVEPKAFRVLLILLRNPQRLISKEELLNSVWEDTAVSENSLARSIGLLRRLLGDETRSPRYIETVATVGYRFICKVEVSEDTAGILWAAGPAAVPENAATAEASESADVSEAAIDEKPRKTQNGVVGRRFRTWLIVGASSLVVALAAVFWYLHRPLPPPRLVEPTQITNDGLDKELIGTDGSRLFLNQGSPKVISQVSITGGKVVPVPVTVQGGVTFLHLFDVSPDGSSFLIHSMEKGNVVGTIWNVRIVDGSSHRLGQERQPAFSPDGKSVAYFTPEGEIWLIQSDGTEAHKLAAVGGPGCCIRWSPNGDVIRFSKGKQIWEISSKGSNLHQLLANWKASDGPCCGSWTVDGKFYLFLTIDSTGYGDQIWALDERRGILRQPPAEPIQITNWPTHYCCIPIPGKNGKKIFISEVIQRGQLSRFDTRTKQFQSFLGGISAQGISFSRDGKSVAYVSYPEGILWKANRDGSNPVQLTKLPMLAFQPRWSPDGTQILFSDMSSDSKIYVIPAQGGDPRRLLPRDEAPEGDPTWSSDGRKVVFASGAGGWDARSDLRILDLDSRQVTVVPDSVGMYSPRWSPDGRYIYATHWDGHPKKIFDVATGKWSVLPVKQDMDFPQWSRDSQFIYFLHLGQPPDRGLYRIRVKDRAVEHLADMNDWHIAGWFNSWMGLDPTDAPLILRDIGSSDIYSLTLEEK